MAGRSAGRETPPYSSQDLVRTPLVTHGPGLSNVAAGAWEAPVAHPSGAKAAFLVQPGLGLADQRGLGVGGLAFQVVSKRTSFVPAGSLS